MTKDEAIELARAMQAEQPDLRRVRPFPVGDDKWLIEIKCFIWRWVVGSRAEFDCSMAILFGDPIENEPVGPEQTEGEPVSVSPIQMEA